MIKLSSQQVKMVLAEASSVIRDQVTKIAALNDKVAAYEKKERAEKLAKRMEDKGLSPEKSRDEKIAALLTKEKLDVIEEAIELSGEAEKIATIDDKTANAVDPFLQLRMYLES